MFWSFLLRVSLIKPSQVMSKCQIFPRSFQFGHNFDLSVHFLGHHVHKDKEKQNTYQTTYQDWQKQWKQASEGRCQILFHGFVLKNYGNLRKVRRFDPRQIQTVSKMVQSRPKDASKLNPTCCKDVPKSSQSFYSKYSYKHKAYLAVSNFYSRVQQRQIQRQTH